MGDHGFPRQTTGLGYLLRLLAWLNWPNVARWLMRRPWHIADEWRFGRWVPIMAYPKQVDLTVAQMNDIAQRKEKLDRSAPKKKLRTRVGTLRVLPGQCIWQLKDGEVVEVPLKRMMAGRFEADIELGAPVAIALNRKNAERKLNQARR